MRIKIPDSLNSETQIVLLNVIHFKSPWDTNFYPEETSEMPFHLSPTQSILVDMMSSEGKYPVGDLEQLNAQAVIIPYKASGFSSNSDEIMRQFIVDNIVFCRVDSSACTFIFRKKLMDWTA